MVNPNLSLNSSILLLQFILSSLYYILKSLMVPHCLLDEVQSTKSLLIGLQMSSKINFPPFIQRYCWETILHVSPTFLYSLQIEELASVVPGILSGTLVWWAALENRKWFPPEWREGLLAFQYNKDNSRTKVGQSVIKDWSFLSLGFLIYDTNPPSITSIWGTLHCHNGTCRTRKASATMKLMILAVLGATKSLISDSRISYLLPASM